MKQWRCTVCDYIDKADAPPANCPVCGSESSLFVPAGEIDESPEAAADQTLRWQCVVCGYIHTGPEPPDKCPVCGADRSQFVCLDRETDAPAAARADAACAAAGASVSRSRQMNCDRSAPQTGHLSGGSGPVWI